MCSARSPYGLGRSPHGASANTGNRRRPETLNAAQFEFCLNYLAKGFNASAAYKAAHPAVTSKTARTEGHRALANPNIRTFLSTQLGDRWKALQMDGDEALGRVAMDARADIRMLFDEKGVRFASKAAARRTILEQTGKLKTPVGGTVDALADAIRADQARHWKA